MPHTPDDLDVLLVGLDRGENDFAVEQQIGGLAGLDDLQILGLQHRSGGCGERRRAVARRATDRANRDAGASAAIGGDRRLLLDQRQEAVGGEPGERGERALSARFPLAGRRLEMRGLLAERVAASIIKPPIGGDRCRAALWRHRVDPAIKLVAAEACRLVARRDFALDERPRHRRGELAGGRRRLALDWRDRDADDIADPEQRGGRTVVLKRVRQRLAGGGEGGESEDADGRKVHRSAIAARPRP